MGKDDQPHGFIARGSIAWSLPTQRSTVLLVEESPGPMLDSFTMTHLSQVIAGEV